MLLRLSVNANIDGIRKFLIQRLPTLSAAAAGFHDAVHPSRLKHGVHGVTEPAARPVVMRAARADLRRGVPPEGRCFGIRALGSCEVLASHVIVTVIV